MKQAYVVGLDGLAITDHNTTDAYFKAREIVEQAGLDLVVIPGVEVSTQDGHMIVLGVENPPPPGAPFNETANQVRHEGGVVVAPHPYKLWRNGIGSLKGRSLDAVEVLNSRSVVGFANYLAARAAAHLGLGVTGGSDAHSLGMVGLAYTDVTVKSGASVKDILNAIKSGRSEAKGYMSPRRHVLAHPFKAFVRHFHK